jgi:F-type H+-transporting ATPase subunit epsilon
MKLSIKIVTPERTVYEDEVDSVTVMTESGEITVLPGHVPLVTNLRAGEMHLKKDGEEVLLAASTGFLQVHDGRHVVVLADTAERVEELELEKIEAAKERARQLLTEKRQADDVSFADAAAAMERELARYKVAMKKYRKIPQKPGETE